MITISITEYMRGYYDRLEYECVVSKNREPVYREMFATRRRAWKSARRVARRLKEQ